MITKEEKLAELKIELVKCEEALDFALDNNEKEMYTRERDIRRKVFSQIQKLKKELACI